MNSISPDILFEKYAAAGFLYPAKMQRLVPFMPLVKENWAKALRLGEKILWFITFADKSVGAWASASSWRSTLTGWNSQHLVSIGGPRASRAVLLAGAAGRVKRNGEGTDNYQQNWFRPSNRFANKVFGSLTESIGLDSSWVGTYQYLAVHPDRIRAIATDWSATTCLPADRDEFNGLVTETRSEVFLQGEELNTPDLELDALDQEYGKVGLRRYRRVFLVRHRTSGAVVAAAVAYRGPLGFNFSFLENRCDLIVHPNLSDNDAGNAAFALLLAVADVYADFPPGFIPIVTDDRTSHLLAAKGAEFIRQYAQSVWLPGGYVGWYRHVEQFYDRVLRAEHRRGVARGGAISSGGKA